jgi:hypothetical protein
MKKKILLLGLLLFVFSFLYPSPCWTLHDDDTISRGGAWDTEDVYIERPESPDLKESDKGTAVEIYPDFTGSGKKETAPEEYNEENKPGSTDVEQDEAGEQEEKEGAE